MRPEKAAAGTRYKNGEAIVGVPLWQLMGVLTPIFVAPPKTGDFWILLGQEHDLPVIGRRKNHQIASSAKRIKYITTAKLIRVKFVFFILDITRDVEGIARESGSRQRRSGGFTSQHRNHRGPVMALVS